MSKSKLISFVGSGPGDFELITVKGLRRLKQADVVIYDRLVNPLLLFHCKKTCEFIYVGKTPYQPTIKQSEINQRLISSSKAKIVRLKGGDPEIFGRLTEELTAVKAANLNYEIIPGITAASGSAAYNGFSLTERGLARSVTIMTGHLKNGDTQQLPVMTQDQTLCLYMGVEALPKFIPHLLKNNFSKETKIAVIGWGTYGRQKTLVATLETVQAKLEKTEIKNPALIVIGEVVASHEEFNWFQNLPKFGEKILLVAQRPPKISELIFYTEQGADIWWQQVGEKRDRRFDAVSERYLAEQKFDTIISID